MLARRYYEVSKTNRNNNKADTYKAYLKVNFVERKFMLTLNVIADAESLWTLQPARKRREILVFQMNPWSRCFLVLQVLPAVVVGGKRYKKDCE